MRKYTKLAVSVLALLILTTVAATPAVSATADFYQGKLVTIIVPHRPGTGTDTGARIIAKYLAEKLDAKVMVENPAAASGVPAINGFFNKTKADGLHLLFTPTGKVMGYWAMGQKSITYDDITSLQYLGGTKRGPLVITAGPKGPYKTIQDMMKSDKQLKFASIAPGSTITLANLIAVETLGLNAQIITGFKGSAERALNIQQGQVDGSVFPAEWSAVQAKKGQLNMLVQITAEQDPYYKDIPALGDLVKLTDYHKTLLSTVIPDGPFMAAPPATPADRVQFLKDNLAAVLADKDFQAEINKVMPPWLGAWSAEEVAQIARDVVKSKPNFKKAFGDLTKKYIKN